MILSNGKISTVGGRVLNSISAPPYGGQTLLQTVNVSMDTANRGAISGWNIWVQGSSNNLNLLNTSSATSGIRLQDVSGTFYDVQYGASRNDPDFPDAVINRLVYTDIGTSKAMKLTGLNNANKYDLLFCSFAADATDVDNTDIIVQGVTKFVAVDNPNTVYKTLFSKVSPSATEIAINVQGSPINAKYGCVNAFIIKEYSS